MAAIIMLIIPDIPFKGSSSVATFNPKQSIMIGANTTSIVLSVDPNSTIAAIKPDLEVTIVANILAIISKTKNASIT